MEQNWLLLDMHLHSEYSKIRKKDEKSRVKKMTAKEFVDILQSKSVKIFSITDHNFFSSKYFNEIEKYIKENDLKMKAIPGVELDTSVPLKNGEKDYIHLCIYFEDNVNKNKLEETINNIYVDQTGTSKQPDFKDILSELYLLKSKFIVIPHGDKERGLFNKKMIDELDIASSEEFYKYAMYKIFNAFDVNPSFHEKSETFWASNFCEKTRKYNEMIKDISEEQYKIIVDHLTKKIRKESIILNSKEEEIYNYIIKYGGFFAYFDFSDWHNNEEYNPTVNNFIYGSLNTAFESFELATLDPISRIIISSDYEIEIPNTILKKVSFNINKDKHQISFTPGLNAIVGKRGSGKSLLLSVIRNLSDQNDPEGALEKYKRLNINSISAENRGNINISLGGLSSVVFLTQEAIKGIFENPEKAQKTISSFFIDIKKLDDSKISAITKLGEKIKPYNQNYKNITSNILSIKKYNDYNYSTFPLLNTVDIKNNFNNLVKEIDTAINSIKQAGLNADILLNKKQEIIYIGKKYLKIIELYNLLIEDNNKIITDVNAKRTNNQVTQRQNLLDINAALQQIKDNFEMKCNLEKIKYLLENFSMKAPDVEINRKGNYIFVTYYEIPDNIKDVIIKDVYSSITWATSVNDIDSFVNGVSNKTLKTTCKYLTSELQKHIYENEIFKPKKEFYEVKKDNINYKAIIKNMQDLNQQESLGNIANLTNVSPGMKSVAYLDMLFDLEDNILILDQPEDNIDNDYISNYLVPNIKKKKKVKQLIFVTHNPSVAVYGDAFNYIYATNNEKIEYKNYVLERREDKEMLIKILEGGIESFSNRNKKFGNVLGEEEYGNY